MNTMRRLIVLLVISVLATGCGLALGAERVIQGREVDVEAFAAKLHAGMTPGDIEEAFGPPFLRKKVRGGEEWRYLEVRRACRPFLLFIPLGPTPKRRTEVRLELGPAGLSGASIEIDPGEDGRTSRRSLLAGYS